MRFKKLLKLTDKPFCNKNRTNRVICIFLSFFAINTPLFATVYYVNGGSGNDSNSGTSYAASFKTIQKACTRVNPGDTVIVAPGVYFEHVQLNRIGTESKPILFRATDFKKNAVIITGADQEIRTHQLKWKLESEKLQLYSIAHSQPPVRVLYDGVDLFPYRSLSELNGFWIANGTPGPHHGFYFDIKTHTLYVRLHPNHQYGSQDPNQHLMQVAPPPGVGGNARFVNKPSDYNFGILADNQQAHVVIEGFTFETPGVDGVYSKSGNFTVRNCWFIGCRWGVSGKVDTYDDSKSTNNVTVEYCDFSHFPTFDDAAETAEQVAKLPQLEQKKIRYFYWWQRKEFVDNTYEDGMIARVGNHWKVWHNHIHDTVDGISNWGCDLSRNCDIGYNLFERLIDNAVEGKNHNQRMLIHDNYIRDVFEPFAWQPMGGIPWPSMWMYRNVVVDTPKGRAYFDLLPHERGCFKLMAEHFNWIPTAMKNVSKTEIDIPAPGFFAYNNTIDFDGVLFTLGSPDLSIRNVRLLNNALVSHNILAEGASLMGPMNFFFGGNSVRFTQETNENAKNLCISNQGTLMTPPERTLSKSTETLSRVQSNTATPNKKGIESAKDAPGFSPFVGALAAGADPNPPIAGPRSSANSVTNAAKSGVKTN
jgi:hypothetical protein